LGFKYRAGKTYRTKTGMLHAIENFCDVAHFSFVHRKSMGSVNPAVPPMKISSNGYEARYSYKYSAEGDGKAELYDKQTVEFYYHSVMPGLAINLLNHGRGGHRVVIEAFCPENVPGGTRIFLVSGTAADYTASTPADALDAEHVVVDEDMLILDSLLPIGGDIPLHGKEPMVTVPADRYTLATRRAWQAFVIAALKEPA
jgi:vanillate O-demethylase monooxygenase subunit